MCCCLSPIIVLASYLKIYCGPIWRNRHFPVPVDYRNSTASKIDTTHIMKAHALNHIVCNALKCWENESESV